MATKKTTSIESTEEKITLQTVYTFVFGRNIYTIKMADIKKITLLAHQFIDKKDDKEEIAKTLYIFSVTGHQIQGIVDTENNKPMYETIMEVKAEEDDYASLYTIYEDLVIKWDAYQQKFTKMN